jgi:alpha-1,6-mannosyltransferase
MRPRLHRSLCLAYVPMAAGAYLAAAQPDGARGLAYMALHFALWLLMAAVWAAGRDLPWAPRWALWTGVVAHLVLVAVPAFTSLDLHRYLWDGHVLLAGIDPYRVAPAVAAEWIGDWPVPPDNVDYPTLYPPGALALFAAAAATGPVAGPWAFRGMVLLGALAVLVGGAHLLRTRGAARHTPLLTLSPLLLLEAQVGTHVDILATAALVGALVLYDRRRWAAAGMALGAGGLLKLLPLVAVAPLALAAGAGGAGVLLAAAAAATLAAGYGLAVIAGLRPLGSLPEFAAKWEFGSPLHAALSSMLPDDSTRWVLLGLGVAAGVSVLLLVRTGGAWLSARRLLVVPLVLSPVVFPWYLVPLVPLVALRPSATLLAWMAAAPLTYEVLDRFDGGGGWSPASWPLACIAAAWGLGLAIDGARAWWTPPNSSHITAPPSLPAVTK